MAKIKLIPPGKQPSRLEYNSLINVVNKLNSVTGRNGVRVSNTPYGMTILGSSTAGTVLRKAFVSGEAEVSPIIDCFLDVDSTGEEITVLCEIAGGANLSEAIPRLEDGDLIYVIPDTDTEGGWRSVMTFQATADCT
jgi:hypothetical protein